VTLDPLSLSRLRWAWLIVRHILLPAFVTAEAVDRVVDRTKMTKPFVAPE
jgi:hypothetical protein